MPEGSLQTNITSLQGMLEGIGTLVGSEEEGGLAAAAAITGPGDLLNLFSNQLSGQMDAVFDFRGGDDINNIGAFFDTLRGQLENRPDQALTGFSDRINVTSQQLQQGLQSSIDQSLGDLTGLLDQLPTTPSAIAQSVLDQLLNILANLSGPEASKIQAWASGIREQLDTFLPLFEEFDNVDDPVSIAVQIFTQAVTDMLQIFGYEPVQKLLDDIASLAENAFPEAAITDVSAIIDVLDGSLDELSASTGAEFSVFRDRIYTTGTHINNAIDTLQPVMGSLRRLTEIELLQPGALESFLREKLQDILDVRINETQKIDDPFNALFDSIDEAIDAVDFNAVVDEIRGFFDQINSAIATIDLPNLSDLLGDQLQQLTQVIDDLQGGVNQLLSDIQQHFEQLAGEARELAGQFGHFDENDEFHFNFETDLQQVLEQARQAIAGNPEDPDTSSVASYLEDFRQTISSFIEQLNDLLDPVNTSLTTVRDDAVNGVNTFRTFLEGLDIAALMNDLAARVEEIIDALLPIDINDLTTPIIAEINDAEQSLSQINPDDLNDLLKEALKVALDVVISIDFTAEISDPLGELFDTAKAETQGVIDQLQRRYEESLSVLDQLNPQQLLEVLFAAYDIIKQQTDSLQITALLSPLDELHEQYLQQPLEALKPSTLLAPVSDAYQNSIGVLDEINGSEIIAPLSEALESVKSEISNFDAAAPLNEIRNHIDAIRTRIENTRPSDIMDPLITEFSRLESELDRFSPSVLLGPVADLATPLLGVLEDIQQEAVDALHEVYQGPLAALDALDPDRFTEQVQGQLTAAITTLDSLGIDQRINQLKGKHFDLRANIGEDQRKLDLVVLVDIQNSLGEISQTYTALKTTLVNIRDGLDFSGLRSLYDEVLEKLESLLPPYARQALDAETFRRLMRLADPTRFLEELDTRFQALRERVIPLSPEDIAAELDETYDTLLGQVENLDPGPAIDDIIAQMEQLKGVVESLRIDFLADDIDRVMNDFRSVMNGFNVARLYPPLDSLHNEIKVIVGETLPSAIFAELDTTSAGIRSLVDDMDPRVLLGDPLELAWELVQGLLDGVDFGVVLAPLVEKIDELEADFALALQDTENAFDAMLGSGRRALGSGGSASVGGSI